MNYSGNYFSSITTNIGVQILIEQMPRFSSIFSLSVFLFIEILLMNKYVCHVSFENNMNRFVFLFHSYIYQY